MRARGFVRLTAALQAFLLLASLVIPGLVSATNPPSLSATLADGIVSVTGADFGADEAVDLVSTDPDGAVVDTRAAQTDTNGSLSSTFALTAGAGTYSVSASGTDSGASASASFEGPVATDPPAPTDPPTDPPTPTNPPTPTDPPTPDPTNPPAVDPTNPPAVDPTNPPAPGPVLNFIVAYTSGSSVADRAAALAAVGATAGNAIRVLNLQSISLPSSGAAAALDALRADPSVIRVDADAVRDAGAAPSDTEYLNQWSLPLIGWEDAFGVITPAGNSIVAILDTGVDGSHPDLAGQLVGGTSILDGSDGRADPNGHGTAMAGIVAAVTDNGFGIAGIGYAGVKVMPVTVLGADGTGSDSDVIAGTVYAVDNGADVILMAFSNPGYSASLQAAIDYAWANNVVVVAATGNDGSSSATYPAGDRGVIGVSNTDQTDALNASSNYGQDTFLAAPGTSILSTTTGGGYATVTGTSASAAEVAAAAALLRANDSGASNGVIVNRLAESADAAGTVEQTGNGRLNVRRALGDASSVEVQPVGAPGGGPFIGPYSASANRKVTVNFAGTGSGQVSWSDGSPTCTSNCFQNVNTTVSITLTAIPGAFTFAGWSGACSGTGTCVLPASSADQTVTATFNKANQTISFTSAAPASATVGGATYTPTATATSGLTVAFTSATPSVCTVAGSTFSFIAVGTCTVNANQAGNGTYNAAPQVQQSFTVGKGNQTISFTSSAPSNATVGGATYTATATATSGLTVTITSATTSVCTIAAGVVTFVAFGTCTLNANQTGNGNFNPAPQVQQSFAVKQNQTISFTSSAPSNATVGGATYTATATATSGLTVTITSATTSVCTIAAGVVTFVAFGTCTLNANQTGNGNFNPAPQVQQSFAVKQNQTISFTSSAPSNATVGGATYTATATATSGLTVTITSATTSVCTIAAGVVTFVAFGTCTLNANQTGNGNFNPAPQVQQSFAVKQNQTISFGAIATKFFGQSPLTVAATASSGLGVTFTSATTPVCTVVGNQVTFVTTGTCTVNANQAGDGNYNAATQVSRSFSIVVDNTSLTILLNPSPIIYGETTVISGTLSDSTTLGPVVNALVDDDQRATPNGNCNGNTTSIGSDTTNSSGDYAVGYRPTAVGPKDIESTYDGDATHNASSACATLTTNQAPTTTTVNLGSATITTAGSTTATGTALSHYGINPNAAQGSLSFQTFASSSCAGAPLSTLGVNESVNAVQSDADNSPTSEVGFLFSSAGTHTISGLVAGTYGVRALFSDTDGNYTNSSDCKTLTVTSADAVAPVVTISTDPADTVAGSGWFNIATSGIDGVLVHISASDPSGVTNITCVDNGSTTVLNVAISTGQFVLGNGMHSIVCNATDGLANSGHSAGSTAMPVLYSIDQAAPSVALSINSAAVWTNNALVSLGTTASDATSGLANYSFGESAPASTCPQATPGVVPAVSAFTLTGVDAASKPVFVGVCDAAGNFAQATDTIGLDRVAPTITNSHTPDGLNGWNKTSPVAETITASDSLSGVAGVPSCSDTLSGIGTVTGAEPNYTANVTGQGIHNLSCTATDAAGNTSSPAATDTVKLDTIAPSVALSINSAAVWTNNALVSLGTTASDATSGLANYSFGESAPASTCPQATPGVVPAVSAFTLTGVDAASKPVFVGVCDAAGNFAQATDTIALDTVRPASSASGPNQVTNSSPFTIAYTASDASPSSGLLKVELWVKVPGGSYVLADTDVTPTITQSFSYTPAAGQGTYSFYTRAFDTAGNIEVPPGGPDAQVTVLYDTTAPVTTDNAPGGWQNVPVTVGLTAIDPGTDHSGVAHTYYKIDAGSYVEGTSVLISAPADHSNDGVHTITYYSIDYATNSETAHSTTVRIDTVKPTISNSHTPDGLNGWNKTSPVAETITASDSLSGVAGVPSCSDTLSGIGTVTGAEPNYTANVTGQGIHNLSCTATDAAGNTSSPAATDTVKLDTIAPSISITHTADGSNGWNVSDPVAEAITASDATSGVDSVDCSDDALGIGAVSGTEPTYTADVTGEGIHNLSCTATDAAGNDSDADTDEVKLDTVKPTISISHTPDGLNGWNKTSPVTEAVTASDATSGINDSLFNCSDDATGISAVVGAEPNYTANVTGQGIHNLSCTATDAAGNTSSPAATDTVKLDTIAPSVALSINSAAVWTNNALVSLGTTASDATSGLANYSFGESAPASTCPQATPGVVPAVSAFTLTGVDAASKPVFVGVCDAAGNFAQATDTIGLDRVAPTITNSHTPDGLNGWNKTSPVAETITASDSLSGVAGVPSCSDTLSGIGTVTGAEPNYTANVTGQGIHNLSCTATDAAGNTSSPAATDTVKLDTIAPSVALSINSAAVWTNNALVSLGTTASDATSGLANYSFGESAPASTCPQATPGVVPAVSAFTLTGVDAASKPVFVGVCDAAGNFAQATDTIGLDRVAPTIALSINSAAVWTNNALVSLGTTASDATSGLANYSFGESAPASTCPQATPGVVPAVSAFTLTGVDAASKPVFVGVCDAAGNFAQATDTIGLDRVAPTIALSINSAAVWTNNALVSLGTTASDATSGLANYSFGEFAPASTCPQATPGVVPAVSAFTLTGVDAASKPVFVGVCDAAGNFAQATDTIGLDRVAPTIANNGPTPVAPNGLAGWYITAVSNAFSASDSLSGLNSACGSAFPKSVSTGLAEGSSVTVASGTCTDVAGNTASSINSAPFKIDLTNPTVAITTPAVGYITVASSIVVSGTHSDTPSGTASVSVYGGPPAVLGATSFTASVNLNCGTNVISAVAKDVAGRTTTSNSITMTRICAGTLQFYQPIDQSTSATPVINTGKFGRVIPVKVSGTLSSGGTPVAMTESYLIANGLTLRIGVNGTSCTNTALSDDVEAYADAGSANDNTNIFRWSSSQWIYNLDTGHAPSVVMAINSCYRLDVRLTDNFGGSTLLSSGPTGPNPYAIFKPTK